MADRRPTCDLWDLTRPLLPPHSRLYALEPLGADTAHRESLTGYIARLAEAHSVPTRALVAYELVPLLGRPRLSRPVNNGLSSFWPGEARSLNGMGRLALAGVQALETLTRRNDLRGLTLLDWAGVLPVKGLSRLHRAWCPDCYESWQRTGQALYEPLLWTLQVVTMCPRHHRPLQEACPHPGCGAKVLPLLAPHSCPGYCSHCGGWLGATAESQKIASQSSLEAERVWHTWVNQAVGDLLTGSLAVFRRQHFAEVVEACAQRQTRGGAAGLALQWGVSHAAIEGWRHAKQLPTLNLLLQICYRLNIKPRQLLTEGPAAVDFSQQRKLKWTPPPVRPRQPRHPFETERVRQALEETLKTDRQPPPTMRSVAMRLGYSPSQIYQYFPELCRAISARFMAYQKQSGQQRTARLCGEIHQIAAQIHAQGVYPSAYRIALQMSQPGFIRHPDAMAAWHACLRELGWES